MSKVAMVRYIADKLTEAETQEEKRDVLMRYSSDTLFKRIIYYTYNPIIVFGMDDYNPKLKDPGVDGGMGISKFMHIPEDLSENKLDTDEDIFACNLVLSHINRDEAEIFVGMLKKDIGVGLTIESINSVWPNLIPNYPVQKAVDYSSELAKQTTFPAVVQPVVEGKRVNIIVRYNTVEFRDSSGKLLPELLEYGHQFSILAQNNSTVFDGCYQEQNKRFVIWDVIKYDGFVRGIDNRLGYNWRFNGLEHMIILSREHIDTPCYSSVPVKMVDNWLQVEQAAKEIKCNVIVKELDSIWQTGPNAGNIIFRVNTETLETELSSNNTTVSTSTAS